MIGERMKAWVLIYFSDENLGLAERLGATQQSADVVFEFVIDDPATDRLHVAHETSGAFCSTKRPNAFVAGIGKAAEMAVVATSGRPMLGQIYVEPKLEAKCVHEIFDESLPRIDLQADDLARAVTFIRETLGA
jgi:hypothetical protein